MTSLSQRWKASLKEIKDMNQQELMLYCRQRRLQGIRFNQNLKNVKRDMVKRDIQNDAEFQAESVRINEEINFYPIIDIISTKIEYEIV